MSDNGVVAISKNPGEITLKGFTFMKDKLPNDFEVCLIDSLIVFTKNGYPILTFVSTSGAEERVLFHMDVKTGEIVESKETGYEDVKMIVSVLGKWYKAFKGELLEGFTIRNYKTLFNNGDL